MATRLPTFLRRLLAGAAAAAASAAIILPPSTASAFECRAALALALDMSSSVDRDERWLQAYGLATALTSPDVVATILSPPGTGVMASAFLWGGGFEQELIADWTRLDSEEAIERFADQIRSRGVFGRGRATAIGEALRYGAYLHGRNPVACQRQIVDVSGDGVNNNGREPRFFRRNGSLEGLQINGLVIRGADPDPLQYYLKRVIQGPGAFVIDVQSYDDYASAMERKLIRELSPPIAVDPGRSPGDRRLASDYDAAPHATLR